MNVEAFAKGQAAAHNVFSAIKRSPAMDLHSGTQPASCQGNIELRDVVFAYPSRPDAPVLQVPHLPRCQMSSPLFSVGFPVRNFTLLL